MKRALWLAAALIVLALVVAAIVHSSPVRRYALRRAVAMAEEQFKIRLEAEELRYDLFALRVELRGVRVAASRAGEPPPFFVARRVSARFPLSVVFERFAIESIAIDDGRVHIVRAQDGRTNLPAAEGEGQTPEALRVGSLFLRRFAIEVTDEITQAAMMLPAIDVTLSGDAGRLYLREPGRVTRAGVTTNVHDVRGGVAFDGRTVRLTHLAIRTDELTVALTGDVALLVGEPGVDLTVRARADAARMARWADMDEPPRGQFELHGSLKGSFDAIGGVVTVRSDSLQYSGVRLESLDGTATVSPADVRVDRLVAQLAGGRVEASGLVPRNAGDARVNVALTGVDIEAILSQLRLSIAPRPTGRADGVLAARGPLHDAAAWSAEGHVRADEGITARNRVGIAGRIDVALRKGGWELDATEPILFGGIPIRPTLRGRLDAHALGRSTIHGVVELPRTDLRRVAASLRRVGVLPQDIAGVDGSIQAHADVSGRFERPVVELTAKGQLADVASLSPDVAVHSPAFLELQSDLRTARIHASLPEIRALGEAMVRLQAPYPANVRFAAPGVPLDRLLAGVATPVPIAGTISVEGEAAGPLARWRDGRLAVVVQSFDARLAALPVSLVSPARATMTADVVDIASLELTAGETRVSALGRIAVREPAAGATSDALLITATGDVGAFLAAAAATRMAEMPDMTGAGPAALLARITGSMERPEISADLELGPGSVRVADFPPGTDVRLRAHSDGKWIELRDASAVWQGSTIRAQGRAPIELQTGRAGVGTLSATLTSVTPRVLEPFVERSTLEQIEGSIDATLHVQSPSLELNDLSGELRLDRMELRAADLPIAQREPTRLAIRDGFVRVEAWQWAGQGGSAGVQGRMRLSDRTAALIADGRFDLRMLTPFTRDAGVTLAGTLEPRVSITGVLDSPRIDGVALVTGAEVRMREPRVIATDVAGRIVLSGTAAHLTSLSGTVNGGTLTGSGSAGYAPHETAHATVRLTAAGMALEFPEGLHSELDADVTVAIDAPPERGQQASGKVSGEITVVRSAYREPIAVAAGLLAALRTRRLAAEAEAAAAPSLADRLALDVRVATDEADVTVDNNIGRLALGADLRVIGTAAAPALSGRANLAEGGQLFLGRNQYEITSGTIDFANPVAIEPELNIAATTRAGGEDIELTITGTAEQPEIHARSPSNPDVTETEAFSLLLTGRRLNEISGDEAEIVGEQALAFLSGDVLGFASRAVGLDTIRLGSVDAFSQRDDASAVATRVDPTARLTFGKSIGRDVDVAFSQGLRDADAQTWIVDYRPRRQLEVRLVSDDEDLRSYELRHDLSFGGGGAQAPAVRPARPRERRIAQVTIAGARAIPEERLRGVLDLDAGDEFDFARWQRDRDRLEALFRRERRYEARVRSRVEGDRALTLVYSIDEGPQCDIEASGADLSAETLAALARAWSEMVFDGFLVEEARAIVAAGLSREGYLQPKVDASLAVDGERKTLRLTIDRGSAVGTRSLRIEGAQGPLEAELRAWTSAGGVAAQAVEDPPAIERALTAWLRARGHVRASVSVGTPRIESAEAIVPVVIDAGPVFTIADVRAEGAHAKSPEAVIEASGIVPGAPFDAASIEAARDRLQALYRRDGFSGARVDALTSLDEPSRAATVTFGITEGARQVLRDVQVSGNRSIDTDVITRALDLPAGEPVTLDDWLQARRRVFETGLFRRADVTPEAIDTAAPQGAEVPMRARVVVEEWPALRLRYGFQVTEERPEGEVTGRDAAVGLSADIIRHTLFGRAVTLGAAMAYQRREQEGRAFLTSRTMFGWPIESSFLVERSRESLTAADLVTHLTGASWEQRVRAWRDLRLSYSYRFERNRTFRTTVRPGDPFGFDLTVRLAWLNATLAWDTRDDVADTSRGWLVSSSFDWAPAALGTDFRFVKHLGQAYYFRPWRGMVFASAARLGVAVPLDDQDLVLSERYYAGGSRTVRGVGEDRLGPRFATGDPAGGESLLVLNQEVRFPVYRWLRGVGFVDAGNVFAEASGITPGDLVPTYGIGLRLSTPFTLIRVDYGHLFSSRPDEPRGRWFFGIGQAF